MSRSGISSPGEFFVRIAYLGFLVYLSVRFSTTVGLLKVGSLNSERLMPLIMSALLCK